MNEDLEFILTKSKELPRLFLKHQVEYIQIMMMCPQYQSEECKEELILRSYERALQEMKKYTIVPRQNSKIYKYRI